MKEFETNFILIYWKYKIGKRIATWPVKHSGTQKIAIKVSI
jgi:hypothetical protein